jgi:hypothetical protein
MKQRKSNQKLLGLYYLILMGLFGSMLFITFSYMPRDQIDIIFLKNNLLEFIFLYMMFNFLLSLLIGMLLFFKQTMSKLLVKMILFVSGVLAFLDFPPIINGVWVLITTGIINVPWTIVILVFHIYLFISLLTFMKTIPR